MENQHRKISGYRELTQEEIDLMNEIKAVGLTLQELVDKVENRTQDMWTDALSSQPEIDRLLHADPMYWVSLGRGHLQQGLMALTRAVAQPDGF